MGKALFAVRFYSKHNASIVEHGAESKYFLEWNCKFELLLIDKDEKLFLLV
jgi:hypothetical protein